MLLASNNAHTFSSGCPHNRNCTFANIYNTNRENTNNLNNSEHDPKPSARRGTPDTTQRAPSTRSRGSTKRTGGDPTQATENENKAKNPGDNRFL